MRWIYLWVFSTNKKVILSIKTISFKIMGILLILQNINSLTPKHKTINNIPATLYAQTLSHSANQQHSYHHINVHIWFTPKFPRKSCTFYRVCAYAIDECNIPQELHTNIFQQTPARKTRWLAWCQKVSELYDTRVALFREVTYLGG